MDPRTTIWELLQNFIPFVREIWKLRILGMNFTKKYIFCFLQDLDFGDLSMDINYNKIIIDGTKNFDVKIKFDEKSQEPEAEISTTPSLRPLTTAPTTTISQSNKIETSNNIFPHLDPKYDRRSNKSVFRTKSHVATVAVPTKLNESFAHYEAIKKSSEDYVKSIKIILRSNENSAPLNEELSEPFTELENRRIFQSAKNESCEDLYQKWKVRIILLF